MRLSRNGWTGWAVKIVTVCAAAVTTVKVVLWLVHPTLVAAQDAIIRPAIIRIAVHETEDKIYQREEREANLAIIQMLALPPGSKQRTKIANAFKKLAVTDSAATSRLGP